MPPGLVHTPVWWRTSSTRRSESNVKVPAADAWMSSCPTLRRSRAMCSRVHTAEASEGTSAAPSGEPRYFFQ